MNIFSIFRKKKHSAIPFLHVRYINVINVTLGHQLDSISPKIAASIEEHKCQKMSRISFLRTEEKYLFSLFFGIFTFNFFKLYLLGVCPTQRTRKEHTAAATRRNARAFLAIKLSLTRLFSELTSSTTRARAAVPQRDERSGETVRSESVRCQLS